ncbi:MAG: 16S rRNA (guanine(527)-N(7))-methyltransferase RsmG [Oscillospiraceae bacterium]
MKQLKEYAAQFDIRLMDDKLILFEGYYNFLIEYNQKVNLTAITQKDDVIIKHFLDSIILLNFFKLKTNSKLIDIGTGAGFPGVPLKIVQPDIDIVLLDARNKKIEFLNQLLNLLNLSGGAVHASAQELVKEQGFLHNFDIVVSRAALNITNFVMFSAGFLKPGGMMVAYKGFNIEEELKAAELTLKKAKLLVYALHKFELPNQNKRSLLLLKKEEH